MYFNALPFFFIKLLKYQGKVHNTKENSLNTKETSLKTKGKLLKD